MADINQDKSSIIKTALNEYTKSYQVLDGQLRLEYLFEAGTHTIDGGRCMVTRYSYFGGTPQVAYVKEYEGVWDASKETF